MKTRIKGAKPAPIPFSQLQPRRFKADHAEQLARLLDFANAGGVSAITLLLEQPYLTTQQETVAFSQMRAALAILNGDARP